MSECKITVVDEDDNVISSEPRELVDEKKLRYKVSALWIKNSGADILLARRAHTKSHSPGKWGPAVAGTVEEAESYEENIIKEAKEELGLTDITLEKGPKTKTNGEHNYYTQWFTCTINKPINEFKIQKEEVAEIKWFSKQELKEALENNSGEFIEKMGEFVGLLG